MVESRYWDFSTETTLRASRVGSNSRLDNKKILGLSPHQVDVHKLPIFRKDCQQIPLSQVEAELTSIDVSRAPEVRVIRSAFWYAVDNFVLALLLPAPYVREWIHLDKV
jgi:hypothetical protein